MQRKPSITVVIPTFNRRHLILGAVNSVLAQGMDDLEIIVVDDGSTDGTRKALDPFQGAVRYFHQENHGVSAARNRGVRESRGEFLAFLDSDDLWSVGKLRAQVAKACDDEVLSFAGVQWFGEREEDRAFLETLTKAVKWPRCDMSGYVIDPVLDVAEGRYLHLGTLFCRRNTFLRVGFFDESLCYGEDEDWFSRASLNTRMHYISEPYLNLRHHVGRTAAESEECLRSLIAVFSKMQARTEYIHPRAHAAAKARLAAKWSHLANNLMKYGRRMDARHAARKALELEPLNVRRLVKVALLLV